MTVLSIEERVEAGARYLDEHEPGWPSQINLDTLNMVDPELCVLGQLYGDVFFGWDHHPDIPIDAFMYCDGERGGDLTASWADLIRERRTP